MPDVAVGVKGIYRNYGRVIEDFLCADDGTYCIGNPGEGIMKQVFTLDYSQHLPRAEAEADLQRHPARRHQALLATTGRRMASYLYSKLDGNYDGEYAPFTNVGADPEHLRRLRLLRLLHQRQRPLEDHQQRPAVERPPPPVQGLRHLQHAVEALGRRLRLLAQRHAAHPLRLLRRLRPLRVLPHPARRRRPHAEQLRRRRPPRLSDRASAGAAQPPARRLQPPQHAARRPARPALGLPGVATTPRPLPSTRITGRPSSAPLPAP